LWGAYVCVCTYICNIKRAICIPKVALFLYVYMELFLHRRLASDSRVFFDMIRSRVWHDPFVCATWLIDMHDMTHSYVWHVSFVCVTCLIHMCNTTRSYVWHDSFMCVTWLMHMCDMTHWYVWHVSFVCVTYLIHMCDMTYSHVWHVSFVRMIWLIYICDMSHSYVWHDSFICVTCLIHMCDRVAPLRMGVRRAAPGRQVLPDFQVISCPWRAASVDQGSLYGPLFGKDIQRFFCSNLKTAKSLGNSEISRNSKISVRTRFEQKKFLISFPKRGPYRLPWSAEAALQGQHITSKSGRTWLSGADSQVLWGGYDE